MNAGWRSGHAALRFALGDLTLWVKRIPVSTREADLWSQPSAKGEPPWPTETPERPARGFLIRSVPVERPPALLASSDGWLRYVRQCVPRYYADVSVPFSSYEAHFSSKTRSTLRRKIRKIAEDSGGEVRWRKFAEPQTMDAFIDEALEISRTTYQHRLYDAALPSDAAFREQARSLAAAGRARGYLLDLDGKAVAYLYCPIRDGVALYDFLGYIPAYSDRSVGTVLQWMAMQDLCGDPTVTTFDFTEGDGAHKRMFATGSMLVADFLYLKDSMTNRLLVKMHRSCDRAAGLLGDTLDRVGLKPAIRRILRARA
jgi:CelD/BcsL family acetyltransferase involved in cellulose biosynthesis